MTDQELSDLEGLEGVYPARQARSRLAQERLLRAGNAVFAAKGYDQAHVAEIARVAGYSIGTFYGRFKDKDALFTALQMRFARRGRANIERFFALSRWEDAPISTVIETYVEGTARIIQKNEGFFRALYQRSLAGDASYWPELRSATRLAGSKVAAMVRRKTPDADRPDLEDLCVFCLRAVEGTLIHRLLHWKVNEEFPDDYILKSLVRMSICTLGIPEPKSG